MCIPLFGLTLVVISLEIILMCPLVPVELAVYTGIWVQASNTPKPICLIEIGNLVGFIQSCVCVCVWSIFLRCFVDILIYCVHVFVRACVCCA